MERVFVDTNIILDWLGEREPFFKYARDLFKKAEREELLVLISTMSFISVEYILRKEIGKEKVLQRPRPEIIHPLYPRILVAKAALPYPDGIRPDTEGWRAAGH